MAAKSPGRQGLGFRTLTSAAGARFGGLGALAVSKWPRCTGGVAKRRHPAFTLGLDRLAFGELVFHPPDEGF